MSTVEIKKELHRLIDSEDDKFLRMFYEIARAYKEQVTKDTLIAEGEEDIAAGKTFSIKEAREILNDWEER